MEKEKNRLRQAQESVEEVKVIMQDNLNKSAERSEKLTELELRAELLKQKSKAFSKTSTKVKQKKQWENNKYKVIIAVVAVALVVLLIVVVSVSVGSGEISENTPTSTKGP